MNAEIESKAYNIDFSKSGGSIAHNVGGLKNH